VLRMDLYLCDRGSPRLDPRIASFVQSLLHGIDKPSLSRVGLVLLAFGGSGRRELSSFH